MDNFEIELNGRTLEIEVVHIEGRAHLDTASWGLTEADRERAIAKAYDEYWRRREERGEAYDGAY